MTMHTQQATSGEKLGDLIYPVEITREARCDVGSQGY